MTSYNTEFFNQPLLETLPKKRIVEMVQLRLTNSLSDLNVSGKKLENKLKKASRSIAKDIAKLNKKKRKALRDENAG